LAITDEHLRLRLALLMIGALNWMSAVALLSV